APATLSFSTWLVISETVVGGSAAAPMLNEPTSWWWNIRVGEQLQINQSGIWYTVVGPVVTANPEGFTNIGPPGTKSPYGPISQAGQAVFPEFLYLVNGLDDIGNGWVDEGYDGVDNNGNNIIDDLGL